MFRLSCAYVIKTKSSSQLKLIVSVPWRACISVSDTAREKMANSEKQWALLPGLLEYWVVVCLYSKSKVKGDKLSRDGLYRQCINLLAGRSGLVVARLPAAQETPGSNCTAIRSYVFSRKSLQYAALGTGCTMTAVSRSTQPSTLRGMVNEYQPYCWVIIHGDGRMFGL